MGLADLQQPLSSDSERTHTLHSDGSLVLRAAVAHHLSVHMTISQQLHVDKCSRTCVRMQVDE